MTAVTETQLAKLVKLLQACRIVDLSQVLAEELPTTWPGHMVYQHKLWNWFAPREGFGGQKIFSTAPYHTRFLIVDEHTSTHFDAPTHFVPPPDSGLPLAGPLGDITGDKVPLAQLQGTAAVIDVSHLSRGENGGENGVSPWVTAQHVREWEARHGSLGKGDIILLRTGWDRYYTEGLEGEKYVVRPVVRKDFPGWPAPSVDLVEYALSKGVRCLGIDAPSIGAAHDGRPAHEAGLSQGMLYVESLTSLDRLPARGSYFVFMPLKIANSSGGPGRALAYVPE
jgi:isatin hydrolase